MADETMGDNLPIVTKEDAISLGLPRYFTGKPCKNGHVSERYTKGTNGCCECARLASVKARAEKPALVSERKKRAKLKKHEEYKAKGRAYRNSNADALARKAKDRYSRDKEAILSKCRLYYARNKDKIVDRVSRYARENRAAVEEKRKKYALNHIEEMKAYWREWRKANPGKCLSYTRVRQTRKRNACPSWVDQAQLMAIYEECARITAETGVEHHVDHTVPLAGKGVCGLHVPWNLQIITADANRKKHINFDSSAIEEEMLKHIAWL